MMPTFEYLRGDAIWPVGEGTKIIAHIVNDEGRWGAGFTKTISRRWPRAEQNYRDWYTNHRNTEGAHGFRLGHNRYYLVEGGQRQPEVTPIWVVHMLAQRGLRDPANGYFRPLRYDALGACLLELGRFAEQIDASVHIPRIGCGLAGGDWNLVAPIVYDALCETGCPVYVYDLEAPKKGHQVNQ
jgi:O-acetyl-ADP-ribose deacetylase (regulator of RNase III)